MAAAMPWKNRTMVRKRILSAGTYSAENNVYPASPIRINFLLPPASDSLPINGMKMVRDRANTENIAPIQKPVAPII